MFGRKRIKRLKAIIREQNLANAKQAESIRSLSYSLAQMTKNQEWNSEALQRIVIIHNRDIAIAEREAAAYIQAAKNYEHEIQELKEELGG